MSICIVHNLLQPCVDCEEHKIAMTARVEGAQDVTELSDSKLYAWIQSVEKGERRCYESGDAGDEQTLRDISIYFSAMRKRALAPAAVIGEERIRELTESLRGEIRDACCEAAGNAVIGGDPDMAATWEKYGRDCTEAAAAISALATKEKVASRCRLLPCRRPA